MKREEREECSQDYCGEWTVSDSLAFFCFALLPIPNLLLYLIYIYKDKLKGILMCLYFV